MLATSNVPPSIRMVMRFWPRLRTIPTTNPQRSLIRCSIDTSAALAPLQDARQQQFFDLVVRIIIRIRHQEPAAAHSLRLGGLEQFPWEPRQRGP